MPLKSNFLLDTLERCAWTFVQTFLGLMLINHSSPWKPALIASGIAAAQALSVALSSQNTTTNSSSSTGVVRDTAYRTVSTFVQALVAFLIASPSVTWSVVYAAAIAAGLAVIKNLGIPVLAQNPQSTVSLKK